MTDNVYIIGGGLAGMAAAVKLRSLDFKGNITIFEAANHLGGRTSTFVIPEFGTEVDNSHIMIKANESLSEYLHLIKADYRVSEFMPTLYPEKRKITDVFKLAMKSIFNTEKEVPLSLLCKTLIKALKAPYPLFPNDSLSKTLVEPFADFAKENNIKIVTGATCTNFTQEMLTIRLTSGQEQQMPYDNEKIIFALNPASLNRIIPDFDLEKIKFNPIANIHFLLSKDCDLPFNFVGSVGGIADWYKVKANLLSVTVSDCKKDINEDEIFAEAAKIFQLPSQYEKYKCIIDKFATITQDKENLRIRDLCLDNLSDLPAEFVGDWTVKELPCTMEAAVISGFKAANNIWKDIKNGN
jgi:hypothetical protein